jgi:acetyl-CoA acyltransferase 1
LIEDIAVGNVLPPGGGATAARMAALHAGIPIETPISTLNRQCASGLAAVNQIAAQIKLGQIDIGIGKYHYLCLSRIIIILNKTQALVLSR